MASQFALPFTYSTANSYGVSAYSLNYPFGLCVDPNGGVYVADTDNNRVLHYSGASTMATTVLGQGGSYTTGAANNGGLVSASSLSGPVGVARDSSGALYVVDDINHRMLYFASGATVATRVYGQGGSFTSATSNKGGVGPNTLYYPAAVVVDSNNKPYIADSSHYTRTGTQLHRVHVSLARAAHCYMLCICVHTVLLLQTTIACCTTALRATPPLQWCTARQTSCLCRQTAGSLLQATSASATRRGWRWTPSATSTWWTMGTIEC